MRRRQSSTSAGMACWLTATRAQAVFQDRAALAVATAAPNANITFTLDGLDLKTIGFLSLVGLPYTFKFLWAPLMDRFDLPWLGRRRGWLVLTQLALAGALWRPALRAPLALLAFLGTGGLFAYFGQTYQTGADAWQLFALWGALALPLCLGARSDALWAPWALVVMTAISATDSKPEESTHLAM